jgi:hypothetical protein
VRCIRPKSDVVSLGRKKASKKLVEKSKVNGKHTVSQLLAARNAPRL